MFESLIHLLGRVPRLLLPLLPVLAAVSVGSVLMLLVHESSDIAYTKEVRVANAESRSNNPVVGRIQFPMIR